MDKVTEELMRRELALLVSTDSGKDSPAGIARCAAFFADRFAAMGWLVELRELGESALPCVIAVNRRAQRYDVLLSGHLDTVFQAGTAAARPYSESDGSAHGPGVCDMKAGCLAMLYALCELSKQTSEKLSIAVILQPDEESGSTLSSGVLREYAEKSSAAMIYEAANDSSGRIERCIERCGRLAFSYELQGVSGHSGNMLRDGSVSAITEAAHWITAISSLTDRDAGTTSNVGLVSGGTADNVVAGYASFAGDVRFERVDEAERAKALLGRLAEHAEAAGVKVRQLGMRYTLPMVPTERTRAFSERLRMLAGSLGIEYDIKKRGGLSAANVICDLVPVCIDGMGPAGHGAHSADEVIRLSDLDRCVRLSCAALDMLAGEK